MKSFKKLVNSLTEDYALRTLSTEEVKRLRETLLIALEELSDCCNRNHLTMMLVGGSALGAVRHKGFIPWDDDLDVAMPRSDFEKLKEIFEYEMGEKYKLSSPNYSENAKGRFPMLLVKDTKLVEIGTDPLSEDANIKIDIFLIDNVPDKRIVRFFKGALCDALMFITSCEDIYDKNSVALRNYMYKTKEGKRSYNIRYVIGKVFSFYSLQKWIDLTDNAFQYKRKTKLLGIPSGRKHYYGEILPYEAFLPPSKGLFEGKLVNLPNKPEVYLSNLFGDYMTIPKEKDRERHMITMIEFVNSTEKE